MSAGFRSSLSVMKPIDYKPAGATEWQRIEDGWSESVPPTGAGGERIQRPGGAVSPPFPVPRSAFDLLRERYRAGPHPRDESDIQRENIVLEKIREIFRPRDGSPGGMPSDGSQSESVQAKIERFFGKDESE